MKWGKCSAFLWETSWGIFKETILRPYLFGRAGSLLLLRLSSSCGERGSPLLEIGGLPAERLLSFQPLGSGAWAHRRGAQSQLLRGTWGLPGSGIELESPALPGEFFTTEPPGKSSRWVLVSLFLHHVRKFLAWSKHYTHTCSRNHELTEQAVCSGGMSLQHPQVTAEQGFTQPVLEGQRRGDFKKGEEL